MIMKHENVNGSSVQQRDFHIKTMASFKEDGSLAITVNINYIQYNNDVYEEDIVVFDVKKSNATYNAKIIDFSVK